MQKKIDKLMRRHDAAEIKILITELSLLLEQAILDNEDRLKENYALKIALLRKQLNDLNDGKVDA